MEPIVLIADMSLRLGLVFVPATIAGLALQRVTSSRSRNRLLYAAICLVTGYVAIGILAATISATPLHPFLVIAALASPVGWGIILWVVWSPTGALYVDDKYWRRAVSNVRHARNDGGETRGPSPEGMKMVRVSDKAAEMQETETGAEPAFGTYRQETRWRPDTPLPFVPGAGSPR